MPTKNEVISEVIRLYDELSYYKRELELARAESPSSMNRALYEAGRKAIYNELFQGWWFVSHRTPVVKNASSDEGVVFYTFDEWTENIKIECFDSSVMARILSDMRCSFEDLKLLFRPELLDMYDDLVKQRSEAVDETV